MKIKSKITNLNVDEIASKTGNIYKSVRVIGKRARQLSATQKEELNEKLAEFASDVDNLEEVFENREQIEISRYFERLPKSTTVASEELVNDELFFRNPEEVSAGWLIEQCGMKGMRVGNAAVSKVHANFIVNEGGAKAEDVIALMRKVQKRVSNETQISLEPEVGILGGNWKDELS